MMDLNISAPPYMYDYQNAINGLGLKPTTSHVKDNQAAYFFKRQLLDRAISVFDFELPENWDKDYTLYILYCYGFYGVLETDKYGVIPQQCGLKGYNVFYHPSEIVVKNSLIRQTMTLKIGVNCEIVKLQPDFFGVMDIVNYYGDMLALTYESLVMNISNSKLAYAFAASKKAIAESFKKMFDDIQGGDLMTVFDKDLLDPMTGNKPWEPIFNDLSHNYIANDLLETMRDIYNMFDTEIGIANNQMAKKKERVNTDEVNANNAETFTKVDLWMETISECFKKVNEMFYGGEEKCRVKWREVMDSAATSGKPVINVPGRANAI